MECRECLLECVLEWLLELLPELLESLWYWGGTGDRCWHSHHSNRAPPPGSLNITLAVLS